jgi:hypothetical protein
MFMTTTVQTATWWSQRKLGCISIALSLVETLIICGAGVLVHMSREPASPLILKLVSIVWLLGGVCSFGLAVAGQ